jgi:hypothetical protein
MNDNWPEIKGKQFTFKVRLYDKPVHIVEIFCKKYKKGDHNLPYRFFLRIKHIKTHQLLVLNEAQN